MESLLRPSEEPGAIVEVMEGKEPELLEIERKEQLFREQRARRHRREREERELSEAESWQQQQESITARSQRIGEDSARCHKCQREMSSYFCSICKHFTSLDKNPYHCEKCGICQIHKDKSFHCETCNVCLDKRLEGDHKCCPDSDHDECCICLEDALSGCLISPCSHNVHRENANVAVTQSGM
ncbi:RING finger and CHY zinc finger domain-containing protein 1-like [Porites lutea]|uniref:RING finger and CHY zinc finger domain-containing protein 1-like n=1 Tax=Porites lutea TaxID=51062 RepID=UPI003CC68BE8